MISGYLDSVLGADSQSFWADSKSLGRFKVTDTVGRFKVFLEALKGLGLGNPISHILRHEGLAVPVAGAAGHLKGMLAVTRDNVNSQLCTEKGSAKMNYRNGH